MLGIQEDKEAKVLERFEGRFRLTDRTELRHELSLSDQDVADVVGMGPNQWHGKAAGATKPSLGPMVAEASFIVLTLGLIP